MASVLSMIVTFVLSSVTEQILWSTHGNSSIATITPRPRTTAAPADPFLHEMESARLAEPTRVRMAARNVTEDDGVEIMEAPDFEFEDWELAHELSGHWGYSWNGSHGHLQPSQWANAFSRCGGKRQSPIEILMKNAVPNDKLRPLRLVDYDDEPVRDMWFISNNGHALQINGKFHSTPQLQGGGLPGKYTFVQLHFHWGANDSVGSEHVIDGKHYPLELHIVHRRKNETDEEADHDELGMAVLGVMFELTNNSGEVRSELRSLIHELKLVSKPDTLVNVTIANLTLEKLLPQNLSYTRYLGSFTTPPCSETVVWTLLTTPLKITEDLLDVLRSAWAEVDRPLHMSADVADVNHSESGHRDSRLLDEMAGGVRMANNFRPIQSSNERVVYAFIDRTSSPVSTTTRASNYSLNYRGTVSNDVLSFLNVSSELLRPDASATDLNVTMEPHFPAKGENWTHPTNDSSSHNFTLARLDIVPGRNADHRESANEHVNDSTTHRAASEKDHHHPQASALKHELPAKKHGNSATSPKMTVIGVLAISFVLSLAR